MPRIDIKRAGPRTLDECWLDWRGGDRPRLPRSGCGWRFAGRWRHGATEAVRFKCAHGATLINVLTSVEERDGLKYYRVAVYRGVREKADRFMMRKVAADFQMHDATPSVDTEQSRDHVKSLWLTLPLN